MGLARALIRRDMLGVLDWLGQVEVPVVAPPLVPLRVVLDADVARQVLVTDADSYGRPWLVSNIMGEGLGRNLFTATGEEWSRRRRTVTPVSTRAHGDELARLMSATLADELDGWRPGPVADIQCPLTDLTLRVAARALLGVDTTRDDLGRRLRDHFEVVLGWLSHRFSHPAAPPAAVPTPRNRAFLRERDQLRAVVGELIARRRTPSAGPMAGLAMLLESGLRDDEIVQECVGWLFAGHETTASTLAWALYSLAVAPEIQARVAAEGGARALAPTIS